MCMGTGRGDKDMKFIEVFDIVHDGFCIFDGSIDSRVTEIVKFIMESYGREKNDEEYADIYEIVHSNYCGLNGSFDRIVGAISKEIMEYYEYKK